MISHTDILSVHTTATGLCLTNTGMLINSIACDCHKIGRKCIMHV